MLIFNKLDRYIFKLKNYIYGLTKSINDIKYMIKEETDIEIKIDNKYMMLFDTKNKKNKIFYRDYSIT